MEWMLRNKEMILIEEMIFIAKFILLNLNLNYIIFFLFKDFKCFIDAINNQAAVFVFQTALLLSL